MVGLAAYLVPKEVSSRQESVDELAIEPTVCYFNFCMRSGDQKSIKEAIGMVNFIESKLGRAAS